MIPAASPVAGPVVPARMSSKRNSENRSLVAQDEMQTRLPESPGKAISVSRPPEANLGPLDDFTTALGILSCPRRRGNRC